MKRLYYLLCGLLLGYCVISAADARSVAFLLLPNEGGRVELHDTTVLNCPENTFDAYLLDATTRAVKFRGCWRPVRDPDIARIRWEDGDADTVPAMQFNWDPAANAKTNGPST